MWTRRRAPELRPGPTGRAAHHGLSRRGSSRRERPATIVSAVTQPQWGSPSPGQRPAGQQPAWGGYAPAGRSSSFGSPGGFAPYGQQPHPGQQQPPAPQPQRRRSPLGKLLGAMIVLAIIASIGLVATLIANPASQAAYQNDSYPVPQPDTNPPEIPQPKSYEEAKEMIEANPFYDETGADPGALRRGPDRRHHGLRPGARGAPEQPDGVPGPGLAAAGDRGRLGDRPPVRHRVRRRRSRPSAARPTSTPSTAAPTSRSTSPTSWSTQLPPSARTSGSRTSSWRTSSGTPCRPGPTS